MRRKCAHEVHHTQQVQEAGRLRRGREHPVWHGDGDGGRLHHHHGGKADLLRDQRGREDALRPQRRRARAGTREADLAIAYSQRVRTGPNGRQQRFTEEEIELLERKWAHFLRQDVEVILFNEDFFAAAVPELKELADALHIKVRR